ncbi:MULTISPECIES: M18 family aminopeptidase [Methylomonas]|uniref:M18 family aminopeptidase n=1 Tax=Methylomonas koyamae TaxID=702114 RepID=A0A177N9J0_9GAMM|nr:M18 family aminopeptidase [Methylomonas koyamae]OAI14264.1 M18 family aminopeptidase [Methylomonas koyamae]
MTSPQLAQDLLDFIDASPSPWHAAATMEQRLLSHGFQKLEESAVWPLSLGGRYYVIRDASSIVAFIVGAAAPAEAGFKILGAHTDSPGLRVKPRPVVDSDRFVRIAVEVYGGPILATFADRDLSLAGRIAYRDGDGSVATTLVRFAEPLLRLPNLAIHMNRAVNEDGLKLNKQTELPLLLANLPGDSPANDVFYGLLESASGLTADQILSWELNVHDSQKGAFWGADRQFIADSQLDNLASCHAGLTALLNCREQLVAATRVCAFFDHEEVGSESNKGAAGSFLADVLSRIAGACGDRPDNYPRALAQSFLVSADMAHAYQPNFPTAYEPGHKILVNHGPVIKINVNHRYASECVSEAVFAQFCQQAGVPYQKYAHRGDLPCGSTIGPITSAKLGIRSVDVGSPMWAMHSARESAGVADHAYMVGALEVFFSNP